MRLTIKLKVLTCLLIFVFVSQADLLAFDLHNSEYYLKVARTDVDHSRHPFVKTVNQLYDISFGLTYPSYNDFKISTSFRHSDVYNDWASVNGFLQVESPIDTLSLRISKSYSINNLQFSISTPAYNRLELSSGLVVSHGELDLSRIEFMDYLGEDYWLYELTRHNQTNLSGFGMGFMLRTCYNLNDNLSVSLQYQSDRILYMTGSATYDLYNTASAYKYTPPDTIQAINDKLVDLHQAHPTTDAEIAMQQPWNVGLSANWDVTDNLEIQLGGQLVGKVNDDFFILQFYGDYAGSLYLEDVKLLNTNYDSDKIGHTFDAEFSLKLLPEKLDLDLGLSYGNTYATDGVIHFYTASPKSILHYDSNIVFMINRMFSLTAGYGILKPEFKENQDVYKEEKTISISLTGRF